ASMFSRNTTAATPFFALSASCLAAAMASFHVPFMLLLAIDQQNQSRISSARKRHNLRRLASNLGLQLIGRDVQNWFLVLVHQSHFGGNAAVLRSCMSWHQGAAQNDS